MEWIDIEKEKPVETGKYVVKTITKMGNNHKLEALCTVHDGKSHFSVTNQVVTHWLKEK